MVGQQAMHQLCDVASAISDRIYAGNGEFFDFVHLQYPYRPYLSASFYAKFNAYPRFVADSTDMYVRRRGHTLVLKGVLCQDSCKL